MKTWKQYVEAARPGGQVADRSLEGFRGLLDQLEMVRKSVLNPEAKQEITAALVPFRAQMQQILTKYKRQGVGYSPNYQPNPAPWSGEVH